MLGYEGIDNDRDGLVNEDSDWDVWSKPRLGMELATHYVQNGALFYPGTLPTRAIKAFIVNHPNILSSELP
jgi:hypothetical protein